MQALLQEEFEADPDPDTAILIEQVRAARPV
jgi:hypothetical protein